MHAICIDALLPRDDRVISIGSERQIPNSDHEEADTHIMLHVNDLLESSKSRINLYAIITGSPVTMGAMQERAVVFTIEQGDYIIREKNKIVIGYEVGDKGELTCIPL